MAVNMMCVSSVLAMLRYPVVAGSHSFFCACIWCRFSLLFYSSLFDLDAPLMLPDYWLNVSRLPLLLSMAMIGNVIF